jgi:hypothetical protein
LVNSLTIPEYEVRLAALEAEVKTLHTVLGTLISWSYAEFGAHGVEQLHKELGRCLINAHPTQ